MDDENNGLGAGMEVQWLKFGKKRGKGFFKLMLGPDSDLHIKRACALPAFNS